MDNFIFRGLIVETTAIEDVAEIAALNPSKDINTFRNDYITLYRDEMHEVKITMQYIPYRKYRMLSDGNFITFFNSKTSYELHKIDNVNNTWTSSLYNLQGRIVAIIVLRGCFIIKIIGYCLIFDNNGKLLRKINYVANPNFELIATSSVTYIRGIPHVIHEDIYKEITLDDVNNIVLIPMAEHLRPFVSLQMYDNTTLVRQAGYYIRTFNDFIANDIIYPIDNYEYYVNQRLIYIDSRFEYYYVCKYNHCVHTGQPDHEEGPPVYMFLKKYFDRPDVEIVNIFPNKTHRMRKYIYNYFYADEPNFAE